MQRPALQQTPPRTQGTVKTVKRGSRTLGKGVRTLCRGVRTLGRGVQGGVQCGALLCNRSPPAPKAQSRLSEGVAERKTKAS